MRQTYIILAILFGFIGYSLAAQSDGVPTNATVFVYKIDGTKHCESYAGESLNAMSRNLADASIEVLSSRKGYDGGEGIAQCGEPTGQINIYEIYTSDLESALIRGFKRLPQNWNIETVKKKGSNHDSGAEGL
jgi:hypothetical protein